MIAEEKEANESYSSFLSPPTFIARPVSTTEGTLIRMIAKEVGEKKIFCSSFVFLSFFVPSERWEQPASLRGALDRT